MTRKLGGPQSCFGCFGEEKKFLYIQDLNPENVPEKLEIIKDGHPCFCNECQNCTFNIKQVPKFYTFNTQEASDHSTTHKRSSATAVHCTLEMHELAI